MSKSRDVLTGALIAACLLGGWALESAQPHASHTGALRDLYASPVCLRADGTPRLGSPTVADAWTRTIHTPITRAGLAFAGTHTITLRFAPGAEMGELTFIAAGTHRWRANDDVATAAWLTRVCGTAH